MLMHQCVVEAAKGNNREKQCIKTQVIGQNEFLVFSSCMLILVETIDSEQLKKGAVMFFFYGLTSL